MFSFKKKERKKAPFQDLKLQTNQLPTVNDQNTVSMKHWLPDRN